MRRTGIILMAAALAAAVAAPAAAAKGKPAPPAPALYQVTMALEGAEGLATTCGTLLMRFEQNAYIADGTKGTSVPRMELAALVPWSRRYPTEATGTEFSGCHGGPVAGSPNPGNGLLRITTDAQGNPNDLMWHFDYYNKIEKVGKRYVETVREHFTLGTGTFAWRDSDGDGVREVQETFRVSYTLHDSASAITYLPLVPDPVLHFELSIAPYQP